MGTPPGILYLAWVLTPLPHALPRWHQVRLPVRVAHLPLFRPGWVHAIAHDTSAVAAEAYLSVLMVGAPRFQQAIQGLGEPEGAIFYHEFLAHSAIIVGE